MNIKIRAIFLLLIALLSVLFILFSAALYNLSFQSDKLKQIEHERFLMFEKSNELQQSSDDLTKYARLYVQTYDVKYKQIYEQILAIRNGLSPKPRNYSSLYWQMSQVEKKKRYPLGEISALKTEMLTLPYLPYEIDKLKESEFNSNDLVKIEKVAFQTMPDRVQAIALLNSKQYFSAKEKIMLPIDDFQHSLSIRTFKAINKQNDKVSFALNQLFVLLFISFIFVVLALVIIKKKVLSPIKAITSDMLAIKNEGKTLFTKETFYDDEIGSMAKTFHEMKASMDDDLKRLNFALNAGEQGWFDYNPVTGNIIVSREYSRKLGYKDELFEINIEQWQKHMHSDDIEHVLQGLKNTIDTKEIIQYTYRKKAKNNQWLWIHSTAQSVEWDQNGNATRIIGILTNISTRKQHEIKENIRNKTLELLVKSKPLKIILSSLLNDIEKEYTNIKCSVLLLDDEGKHLLTGAAPSLPDFYNEAIHGIEIGADVGSCGTAAYTQKRVIVEDIQTHPFWNGYTELAAKAGLASCWSDPIFGENNKLLGTFAIYHSKPTDPCSDDFKLIEFISQLAAIAIERSKTREQLTLYSRVFSDTHEGIAITNDKGIIIDVNPAFSDISGYTREEVIGKNPSILSSGKQPPSFYKAMWNIIADKGFWQGEVWNRKKSGEFYAELLSISALTGEDNAIRYYVGISTDITKNKKQQDKINLMAHYDVLTKLPNRALFSDRFHQAIAHSKRTKDQLAICFLDLDNFKPINDNFGHNIGDNLLIEVSKRIKECIREEDTISRQGGDEFAMLLSNISSYQQCEQTLKRIHHSLSQPYIINGLAHYITASSGFTLYPDDEGDIDTLLRHADQAMYQAKLSGKNRYHLYNVEKDKKTVFKHQKLTEIKHALNNEEFQLYYQPKVNMKTGEVYGVEALIRWIHPVKGLIPPLDFLPLVEGTDLEIKIGNWVINQAIKQLERWKEQNIDLVLSINISSFHLLSALFVANLGKALNNASKIDSSHLELEILESSVLSDIDAISQIINVCRRSLGVQVALDDFGTGYSSLTHLKNLPANIIKIDQSFIKNMLEDPSDYAIVEGIIALANSFGRKVIAEGVETTEHGLLLILMGCKNAQGYGIAKPMPVKDISKWLTTYVPNQQWIERANRVSTAKERKVAILKLVILQWITNFKININTLPENIKNWSLMSKEKCACGKWIRRERQGTLLEQAWLDKMSNAHKIVHDFADITRLNHDRGHTELATEGLEELLVAFDAMVNICDDYG